MTAERPNTGSNDRAGAATADVAVVIVNYRTPELAVKCLEALGLERDLVPRLRVALVDGGSGDASAAILAQAIGRPEYRDWVSFIPLPINGGFGWANNQAIQQLLSQHDELKFIHLLNPDAEVEHGAVAALVEYLDAHPRVAAVGSQLLEPDGSQTASAFSFPSIRGELSRGARTGLVDWLLRVPPVSIEASRPSEVDWVTGASVMFRVKALRDVGFFDEGFFLYNEEVELMWRMRRAGWLIAIEPRSRVSHLGGASTGIHDRQIRSDVEPRKGSFLYRSRARFFGLTRGRTVTLLAFGAWTVGHAIWRARRFFGLAPHHKPVDHQLRDHIIRGFPRKHDCVAALPKVDATPTAMPAWMENQWL